MSFGNFTCSKCGKSVSGTASVCPHCGINLAGVRCSHCGYTGSAADFLIFDLSAKPDPNTACLTIFFGGIALYGGWMSIAALIWHRKSKGTASKRK